MRSGRAAPGRNSLTWPEWLVPEPALIPAAIDNRVAIFGLINEIAGENGLAWCKRLIMLHQRLTDQSDAPVVHHRFKDR
jgi:hypothetical protein